MKYRILTGVLALSVCTLLLWALIGQSDTKNTNEVKITEEKTHSQVKFPGGAIVKGIEGDTTDPASLWVVVSKRYPLANQTYRPADLVLPGVPERTDKSQDEKSVRRVIVPSLEKMFADAKAQGHDLMVASGFRSYEQQQAYFDTYTAEFGREAANRFSALPGQSEHQTGLSLDIAYTDMKDCYLDACFGERPAGKWLAANSYEYGFILRYPADKVDVTKYQYEPWHFRYIGRELATALYKGHLSLDEARPYLELQH